MGNLLKIYMQNKKDSCNNILQGPNINLTGDLLDNMTEPVDFTTLHNYIPSNFWIQNFTKDYFDILKKVKNKSIIEQLSSFLKNFSEVIDELSSKDILDFLPPLFFRINEDDSILVEWKLKNFRIGFNFEHNKKNSNWYLVSNFNNIDSNMSSNITEGNIKYVLELLTNIVIINA